MSHGPPSLETSSDLRRRVVQGARTFVVKIGTNVLARPDDTLDLDRIAALTEQLLRIRATGRKVVVVSSGAIGAGIGLLGLPGRPTDLPHLQAAAAVGQAHLIRLYDDCLARHGYRAAQLLLTANDFKQRGRYLNVRNTLHALLEFPVIPVINENDTVSVAEIKFGDNDQLAAMVGNLMSSALLAILSVVDGLYDGPPDDPGSRVIPLVQEWDDSLKGNAVPTKSRRGTGGMSSKLDAVRTATAVGENVVIANGTRPDVLDRILAGDEVGTLFLARQQSVPAWKRWIGFTVRPRGRIVLDDGARAAVETQGRSLLAIGIRRVEGEFGRGEVVSLVDPQGHEFARGLSNYDSRDARLVAGKRSEEIARLLGAVPYDEVIHRDNLVVIV
jgi:glutamate 5-kinase